MRLLHTSDWHLGHTLHSVSRTVEHQRFLDWLLETLSAERVDALLVAGDVFDTANPSVAAQTMWFRFLGAARAALPDLDIVVTGGNHDSPGRLDATDPILRALRVHVVGALPRDDEGELDLERIAIPLHDRAGAVAAWCGAVPFLRVGDLPRGAGAGDVLPRGVRAIYREVTEELRGRCAADQALILMGHLYLAGGTASELSERRIFGGHADALPADIFDEGVAYVALGHLHEAQAVGGRPTVRYAGSPLPLAIPEASYRHQVCLVDLEGAGVEAMRCLPVPRTVDILRLPDDGPADLETVRMLLEALPALDAEADDTTRPFLEVRVRLEEPRPDLRSLVEADVDGKHPRLVKIAVEYIGEGGALADEETAALEELTPEQVFRRLYATRYPDEPPADLLTAFHELLDGVHQGAEPEAEPQPQPAAPA